MKKRKAMTLMELMIVVIVLGILVSIAVPNYQKAVTRAKVKEAETALRAIYAAQKIYYLKNGQYPFPGLDNIDAINNTFHLDLLEENWDYKTGTTAALLGQADIKPLNNIGLRIGDAGIPTGCTTGGPGIPCCYKGCTLY